jgi:metal-dependent HD superfamily phosphatase/phosphodiesterase
VTAPSYETVVLEDLQDDPEILAYVAQSDDYLGSLGYTEHGLRHANLVAHISGNVLRRLGFEERTADLAAVAGFLHDIGNCVSREFHGVSAAMIAKDVLYRMNMDPKEIALVMNAIGNHEEEFAKPNGPVAAAAIMADKSDVHHTRVRNPDPEAFDIHDRVNHSAKRSFLRVDEETRVITLEIDIDTEQSQVMEYFEIFLSRMQMCRAAAEVMDATFSLVINDVKLL